MSINLLDNENNDYLLCVHSKYTEIVNSGLEDGYVNPATTVITTTVTKVNYNPSVIIVNLKLNLAEFTITSNNHICTDVAISATYRPTISLETPIIVSINSIETVCKMVMTNYGKIIIKPLTTTFLIDDVISFYQLTAVFTI